MNIIQQILKMQWSDYLDILVVAYLIYKLLPLLRTPHIMRLARTVIALVLIAWITSAAKQYTINWLLNQLLAVGLLAFVVLFNLTNIDSTERRRELATLKVLGFYDGELSAYVYGENVILTVFGVALGMFLGKLLHQWLILTVEIDMLMFGRFLEASSYGWAILLTVIFSLLVNLAAHRKLKKLDMVESLKSVE